MQKYTKIVLVQWIVCAEVILYIGVCNSFSLGTELALRSTIIVGFPPEITAHSLAKITKLDIIFNQQNG